MLQLKKYIIGSCIFHLVLILISVIVTEISEYRKKSFIVFGAHSRKPSFVLFKDFKHKKQTFHASGVYNQRKAYPHRKIARSPSPHVQSVARVHTAHAKKVAKTHTVRAKKEMTKKSTRHFSKQRAHTSSRIKEIDVPDQKPVIHELSDNVNIAVKKHAKHKKNSHQQSLVQTQKKEIVKQKYVQRVEPAEKEDVIPQPEKRAQAEPEKINEKKAEVLKREHIEENESALPDDQPPADIVQVAQTQQTPDESATSDQLDDYAGFNLIGNYDQKDLVVYQRHVQREVDRLWRPPIGVPKGTVCTVIFTVGEDGTIEQFEILKKSDVIIYDVSIIRVAKSFQFDKSLWGKQFKIDFRQ